MKQQIKNTILVAITETKIQLEGKENLPLIERLKIAMKSMVTHWLVVDEDEQFQAAIGAVLLVSSEKEREQINNELKGLRAISSMISGVSIDLEVLEKQIGDTPKIGLQKIWREIKEKAQ